MTTKTFDELKQATAALPATWISEVVLQTSQYDLMKDWYEAVLGTPWHFENRPARPAAFKEEGDKQVRAADVRACFMRLDTQFPYGITFAIFELPWVGTSPAKDPGLNHMQFKNRDLATLVSRLEMMRDAGIHPQRSANHGPSLSFYFKDPDLNVVELCINTFDTAHEAAAFVRSEKFRNNPSGLELDRDEFIARYHSGIPKDQLLSI
jgi:hypothetical protein